MKFLYFAAHTKRYLDIGLFFSLGFWPGGYLLGWLILKQGGRWVFFRVELKVGISLLEAPTSLEILSYIYTLEWRYSVAKRLLFCYQYVILLGTTLMHEQPLGHWPTSIMKWLVRAVLREQDTALRDNGILGKVQGMWVCWGMERPEDGRQFLVSWHWHGGLGCFKKGEDV